MLDVMNFYAGMKLYVSLETNTARFGSVMTVGDIMSDDAITLSLFGENGEELVIDMSTANAHVDGDGVEVVCEDGSTIYLEDLEN